MEPSRINQYLEASLLWASAIGQRQGLCLAQGNSNADHQTACECPDRTVWTFLPSNGGQQNCSDWSGPKSHKPEPNQGAVCGCSDSRHVGIQQRGPTQKPLFRLSRRACSVSVSHSCLFRVNVTGRCDFLPHSSWLADQPSACPALTPARRTRSQLQAPHSSRRLWYLQPITCKIGIMVILFRG